MITKTKETVEGPEKVQHNHDMPGYPYWDQGDKQGKVGQKLVTCKKESLKRMADHQRADNTVCLVKL